MQSRVLGGPPKIVEKCPKCKVPLELGIAIDANSDHCLFCCSPALITHETLKLVDVWKCPKCGHSEDNNA